MNENFRFKDLPYVRPDFAKVKTELAAITEKMKNAASYDDAKVAYFNFEATMSDLRDAYTIVSIRHTVDTRDKFYDDENEFLSEAFPELSPYTVAFSNALYDGKFKADFEKEFGKQLLSMIELERKSFSEKNIPHQQREAKLCNEYEKIIASAEIDFDGEKRNLYGVMKYFEDENREVRKAAWKKYEEFFASHEKRFEEIWDELIKVRNEQGRNLGFENFIPLGYMQQGRTDYNAADVASFREQVKEELVPLCSKLYEAQAKRLNLDKVRVYDENCVFADGNATPIGNDDELVEIAREMYKDMSKETGEFIDFMIDHELLDLKNKPGKASTGYMTSILKYKAPFVFSCFNGTIGDIQVLTHELGHAFAGYEAMRNQPIADYYSESTDIAEIHSMSMEQFAYPYAEKFFGDKADKFRFQHLQEAITFVPFGVAVDEYQHIVYAHPELTPKERTAEWKKLEEKYLPSRDYDGMEFFGRGGWWYHKIHIFLYPFYYINYTLTTMGAMEFKKKMHEDKTSAWNDYMNLCKVGGSKSYLETLAYANLSDPFKPGSVKKAISFAKEILLSQI